MSSKKSLIKDIDSTSNKTRDIDPVNSILKNGYSSHIYRDNSWNTSKDIKTGSNKKSVKNAERNKSISNSPKKSQKIPPKVVPVVQHPEVNRILNVLHKNLKLTPEKCNSYNTSLEQDPKRAKVRKLLQRHFEMKEEELRQSYDTIQFNDISKMTEIDFSTILRNLETYPMASDFKDLSPKDELMKCQPSKGETMQFFPNEDDITNEENWENEFSMQFENISRISDDSIDMKIVNTDHKPFVNGEAKQPAQLSPQKIKIMMFLLQIYWMAKTNNPFDFRNILAVWALSKSK